MLDGIAPAIKRPVQPDTAVCVARDLLAPAMSLVGNRAQLFDRQRRLRNQFTVLAYPRTVRHVDLDPVRAMVELFPRRLAGLDGTVGNLRSLGHFKFRRVTFQRIASGGRNRSRRHEHPWPRDVPSIDRLLDPHITVAGTLSF